MYKLHVYRYIKILFFIYSFVHSQNLIPEQIHISLGSE